MIISMMTLCHNGDNILIDVLCCQLVPLLIESLSLNNERLVLWTLTSFKLLLGNKHNVFSEKLQCVIPRLMELSTHSIMVILYITFNFLNSHPITV